MATPPAASARPAVRSPRFRARVCGVVLCGGQSRRMGRDKALCELDGGGTLLEHAVRALEPLAAEVVLACGAAPRYAELGRRLVLDRPRAATGARAAAPGPLAGIEAALASGAAEWFLVLACDLPRAEPELFAALLGRAQAQGLDCCLFQSARGLEPLCGAYHRRCLAPISAALAAGERRVVSFRDFARADGARVRLGTLAAAELPAELGARDPAHNLNTPADLDLERRRAAQGGAA